MARARAVRRWLIAGCVVFALAVLGESYGQAVYVFTLDHLGPVFSYYDNGRTFTVRTHRLPELDATNQAPPGTPWPEVVLRPTLAYTLDLLGLSASEGSAWRASMEGVTPGVVAPGGAGGPAPSGAGGPARGGAGGPAPSGAAGAAGAGGAMAAGGALVVREAATGREIGRYVLGEGGEATGLAVVELDLARGAVYLMDVMRPAQAKGWYVVRTYLASGSAPLTAPTSAP